MFQIRRCQLEDFEDVVRLLRQLWPGKSLDVTSLRMVFSRALVSESQIYLCASDKHRVVGFGSATLKNNLWQQGYLAHVDELIVDGEQRGRGVGKRLLERLIMAARQGGCHRIELDTAFHRKRAHAFYEQLGFVNRAYLFSKEI